MAAVVKLLRHLAALTAAQGVLRASGRGLVGSGSSE